MQSTPWKRAELYNKSTEKRRNRLSVRDPSWTGLTITTRVTQDPITPISSPPITISVSPPPRSYPPSLSISPPLSLSPPSSYDREPNHPANTGIHRMEEREFLDLK